MMPIVQEVLGEPVFIHIAQHKRRTKNAPENTWSTLSTNKRGYKSQLHFQLGIWEEYVFVYLSLIDQPKKEREMADYLLAQVESLRKLPSDFVYSTGHVVSAFYPLSQGLEGNLIRFKGVKKAEFEVGRFFPRKVFVSENPVETFAKMRETIQALLSLYQALYKINQEP